MDTRKTHAVVALEALIDLKAESVIVNQPLVTALRQHGMTTIDLFFTPPLNPNNIAKIRDTQAQLKKHELTVRNVITPSDYAWHLKPAELKGFYEEATKDKNEQQALSADNKTSLSDILARYPNLSALQKKPDNIGFGSPFQWVSSLSGDSMHDRAKWGRFFAKALSIIKYGRISSAELLMKDGLAREIAWDVDLLCIYLTQSDAEKNVTATTSKV